MSRFSGSASIATTLLVIGIFLLLLRVKTTEETSNQMVQQLAVPDPIVIPDTGNRSKPVQTFSQSRSKLHLNTPIEKI